MVHAVQAYDGDGVDPYQALETGEWDALDRRAIEKAEFEEAARRFFARGYEDQPRRFTWADVRREYNEYWLRGIVSILGLDVREFFAPIGWFITWLAVRNTERIVERVSR